ncbi:MAG: hypothetical protein IJU71_04285 [Selenomonadaceae bacterium]|nr:hypothetical protein [Selenomonadaceae bacterium]
MGFKIIVAGIGRRALSRFAADDRITFPITADIAAAVAFIRSNVEHDDGTVLAALDGTILGLDQNAQQIGGELHWDIKS